MLTIMVIQTLLSILHFLTIQSSPGYLACSCHVSPWKISMFFSKLAATEVGTLSVVSYTKMHQENQENH